MNLKDRHSKSMRLGGGGRFQQLKEKISKESGVTNPAAVVASIGFKKYGKAKMESMAHRGR